jgi:carbonic anhydrase/acetyltransferase-like protein (isoleucine patch superfamily)
MLGRYAAYQPKIAQSTFVAPNAVIIGNVSIGENCVIWFGVIIRGAENEITIGERTIIEDNCVIHSTLPLHIGKNVIIGHNSVIHSCTIEDDVLLGPNVCVYDGAEIKTGAMIGINSVIQPKQVVEPKIYLQGNPVAKRVKKVKVDLERNQRYIEKNIAQASEYKKKFAML